MENEKRLLARKLRARDKRRLGVVSLDDIVCQFAFAAELYARDAGVTLIASPSKLQGKEDAYCGPGVGARLDTGNRTLLLQCLWELLYNSIQAGAKNITVGNTASMLYMMDDGHGFEIEPYDAMKPGVSTTGRPGMGLYDVADMVSAMDGRIVIVEGLDKGAEVRLEFGILFS